MFYGLTSGAVKYPGYEFEHDLCDLESLNHRALKGEVEVTAVSVHAYAHLKEQYVVLQCGASMGGEDYGPRLVALEKFDIADRTELSIAIPGELTSAALALRMYLHENNIDAELVNEDFDKVQDLVKDGTVDAGVIIHEGQITHPKQGFEMILDLGVWWWEKTGLPMPLGVNVVRKDLGTEGVKAVGTVLKGKYRAFISE